MWQPAAALSLTAAERADLEMLVRSGKTPHRNVQTQSRPRLFPKLRDVVGVYLHPPDKALVVCVDEKPQVQALDRTEPVLLLQPGIPARQTHGVCATRHDESVCGLNISDRPRLPAPRKRHTEFLAFLDQLDRSVPKPREIHLILANNSTHTHPNVEAWFANRPPTTVT
jgi:hypothetical protein